MHTHTHTHYIGKGISNVRRKLVRYFTNKSIAPLPRLWVCGGQRKHLWSLSERTLSCQRGRGVRGGEGRGQGGVSGGASALPDADVSSCPDDAHGRQGL